MSFNRIWYLLYKSNLDTWALEKTDLHEKIVKPSFAENKRYRHFQTNDSESWNIIRNFIDGDVPEEDDIIVIE